MKSAESAPTRRAAQGHEHAGFFVVRTPLLPIDEFFAWTEHGRADGTSAKTAAQRLRFWLAERLHCAVLREALRLASPSLEARIDDWLTAPDSERGRKVEHALVRYFSRMASRPTPFGLFAGCSLGQIGAGTAISLRPRSDYRRTTRLDQGQLLALTARLDADRDLRRRLRYVSNTTLSPGGGRWRYVEVRMAPSGRATYHLVAVERSPYLEAALNTAADGAQLDELSQAIMQCVPGVGRTDAESFVHELISSQILCSDLEPPITGEEPLASLLVRLGEQDRSAMTQTVRSQAAALAELDRQGLGQPASAYAALQPPTSPAEGEAARAVHVDLWKPVVQAQLDDAVVTEVLRGVTMLARLTRGRADRRLAQFKEAFRARYESSCVPLLLALDPECGIGFGDSQGPGEEASLLLKDLQLKAPAVAAAPAWTAVDRLLLQRLTAALSSGASQIELTEADLAELPPGPPLPSGLAVLGALMKDTTAGLAADAAWQFRLDTALGPSCATLLGRFAHCDPKLRAHLMALMSREQSQRSDAILAEIVHRPPGRASNVAVRPRLREYEIPVLCRSGAPSTYQVALRDLWLSLSLEDNQLILTSQRLGRRVVPRLGNAHNYIHPSNFGLYRFLCTLQEPESPTSLSFSWGPLVTAEYLPRVVSGRLILAPARWHLTQSQLRPILSTPPESPARLSAMDKLRQSRCLPRLLCLPDGDNALLIDLDNILSIEAFLDLIQRRNALTVEEYLLGEDRSLVTGPEGRFANEIVLPLQQIHSGDERQPAAPPLTLRAGYPPGSEWLYYKLYTGMATADRLLLTHIRPLVTELLSEGLIDRWHFVRYADPSWHVRLRVHGAPHHLEGAVLRRFNETFAPLLGDGQLARIQLDTYEPEWQRYGGEHGLRLSELLFEKDSQAALGILDCVVGDALAPARWRSVLCSMAFLLSDLFSDSAQRLAVVTAAYHDFSVELQIGGETTRRLGSRYRAERGELEALLRAAEGEPSDPQQIPRYLHPLYQRSRELAPIAAALRRAEQQGVLTVPLPLLARSYLHMTANRLFRSAARAQEAVLYGFLSRLYRSRISRHCKV